MVKPGGTGTPRLVISASSHPLPPRSGRIALLPSALPFAKAYTYRGVRAETARDLPLGVFRFLVTAAISATPWPKPSGGPRRIMTQRRPGGSEIVSAARHNVNDYSSATRTYAHLLPVS